MPPAGISERIGSIASWANELAVVAVVHAGVGAWLLSRRGSISNFCRWLEIRSRIKETAGVVLVEASKALRGDASNFAAVSRQFARENGALDWRIRLVHGAFYMFIICEGVIFSAAAMRFASSISDLAVGGFMLVGVGAFCVELLAGLRPIVLELMHGPAGEAVKRAESAEAAAALFATTDPPPSSEEEDTSFVRRTRALVWMWSVEHGWEVECVRHGSACILLSNHEHDGATSISATASREHGALCAGHVTQGGQKNGSHHLIFVPNDYEQFRRVIRSSRVPITPAERARRRS